jgi:hypothetical protein
MNQTTGSETPSETASSVREQVTVAGNQAVDTVRRLVAEGNVRSVVVRHGGKTIVSFPVTIGVIGTVLAPQVALLGLVAAVLTQCTIEVVREGEPTLPTV